MTMRFAVSLLLLTMVALPLAAQTEPDAPSAAQQQKPPGISSRLPRLQEEAAEARRDIEAGMKAQPRCTTDPRPCVLTPREKFGLFVRRSYSPFTFFSAALDASWSQVTGEEYGSGFEGWAQRYGSNLADGESRAFFHAFVFASLMHQDPRYHRMRRGHVLFRAAYAASRVFVGRMDDGRNTFNYPYMAGLGASRALGNLYHPKSERGVGATFSRIAGGMGSDAGTNVLREFWPDIKRVFKRERKPEAP